MPDREPTPPKIQRTEMITDTGVFRIQAVELEFSNGANRRYQRILGSPQGAVLVVPLLDDRTVLLIREYATGMERYELAFPKGHIEPGEGPFEAARREMEEEIGYGSEHIEPLRSVTLAPGYLRHTTHMVVARNLYESRREGDEPEPIVTVPWRLDQNDGLLAREDFTEARSILALLLLKEREARRRGG